MNPLPVLVALVAGVALTAGCVTSSSQSRLPAERLLASTRPLVIAHRGHSATTAENTLPAFQRALQSHADLVELDYHHSLDGVLTVIHDGTLDRTTDATRRWGGTNLLVSRYDWSKLRELDASSWRGAGQPPARLPTLEEALDVIQTESVTLIERKAGGAAACVELLRRKQLVNRAVVQSFDWQYLEDYHRLEPSQVLGALGPWGQYRGQKLSDADKALAPRWVDEARRVGARVIVWNKQVGRESVRYAHDAGLRVWVYTIDDPALMRELVGMGVDGIITNNPDVGRATLK